MTPPDPYAALLSPEAIEAGAKACSMADPDERGLPIEFHHEGGIAKFYRMLARAVIKAAIAEARKQQEKAV
jgi:hypothetical protein